MEIVTYTLEVGEELTHEEHAAMAVRLESASKLPYVYDPDCPLLTPEQLAEFRPVNFATMEERALAMRKAGIKEPETAYEAEKPINIEHATA